MNRRHFLSFCLSGASAAALLAASPAQALQLRSMTGSEADAAAAACSVDTRHADLIKATLEQARADGLQVDEASVRQAVLMATACPYCKCNLTAFDVTF